MYIRDDFCNRIVMVLSIHYVLLFRAFTYNKYSNLEKSPRDLSIINNFLKNTELSSSSIVHPFLQDISIYTDTIFWNLQFAQNILEKARVPCPDIYSNSCDIFYSTKVERSEVIEINIKWNFLCSCTSFQHPRKKRSHVLFNWITSKSQKQETNLENAIK